MKPKLEKFLRRAVIDCPGHAVVLIAIKQETGETEIISNFQTKKDMHEAILNVASNITPPDQTLWQKIKSVFIPKPILK